MDSFTVVRKAPPSSKNDEGFCVPQILEAATSKSQHLRARPRYAPYSTEERVRRIQKALDDAKGNENAVLRVCPGPDVPQPSVQDASNISEFQARSSHPETEARTRHISQSTHEGFSEPGGKSGQVLKREHVLDMKHPLNPIIHSDAPRKSQNFVSCSNGHQSGRGGIGANVKIFREMETKLANQATATEGAQTRTGSKAPRPIFQGLQIYVNGYVRGTTRSELVRLVTIHGGLNLRAANSATHIVTSMGLSGSKSQRFLGISLKKRANIHVVRPEWLFDSINAEKRLDEYTYRIVKSEVQGELRLAT